MIITATHIQANPSRLGSDCFGRATGSGPSTSGTICGLPLHAMELQRLKCVDCTSKTPRVRLTSPPTRSHFLVVEFKKKASTIRPFCCCWSTSVTVTGRKMVTGTENVISGLRSTT
eukprot:1319990-Rhodomonas_salina.2